MANELNYLFLEFSEPVVILEADRVLDWKGISGSLVDGKFVASKEANDSSLASKIDPPADLLPLNGKDTLIARAEAQCSGTCWLQRDIGGILVFTYSFEEPNGADIQDALNRLGAKTWKKLEFGIGTTSSDMVMLSSLSEAMSSEVLPFQLAPGFYDLMCATSADEEGSLEYEFIAFVPGKPRKKKAKAVSKKNQTLAELLKNGSDSSFKTKKALLESEEKWTAEMATDAALAVERLSNASRRLLYDAIYKQKVVIPAESAQRLENYILSTQDETIINSFLFRIRLQNPDYFIVKIAELGLLDICRHGLEYNFIDNIFFSQKAFTRLYELAKTEREIVVVTQILLHQIRGMSALKDFSFERSFYRAALGGEGVLKIEIRKQMFSSLSAFKNYSAQESILAYFESFEELMRLLGQTLEIPEIAESRGFIAWLAELMQDCDPAFRDQMKTQYPKIWEAAVKAPSIVESWKKK